jgi:hypothetical protein
MLNGTFCTRRYCCGSLDWDKHLLICAVAGNQSIPKKGFVLRKIVIEPFFISKLHPCSAIFLSPNNTKGSKFIPEYANTQ